MSYFLIIMEIYKIVCQTFAKIKIWNNLLQRHNFIAVLILFTLKNQVIFHKFKQVYIFGISHSHILF